MYYNHKKMLALALGLLLVGCITSSKQPVVPNTPHNIVVPLSSPYLAVKWEKLPEWQTQNLAPSWTALLESCRVMKIKPHWQEICSNTAKLDTSDNTALRAFYETWFTPYQVLNPDGSDHGMITGYYEPKLFGSRSQTARFRYPLYAVPADLLTIDLGEEYPQLKNLRLRGQLKDNRVVPYYTRAEIDAKSYAFKGTNELLAPVICWVESEVELYFLQVEGSGRIELPDGKLIRVGYADQNGQPYVAIGKKLVEAGELKLEEVTMQSIKNWAEKNPDKLPAILKQNPSYVFFQEFPDGKPVPNGTLGVTLTDEYSLAVDPRTIPLGMPVFLSTTYPEDKAPLNRLMMAQDTGGAIAGAVRADFFWGYGEKAANQAGKMKQQGRMWVLFPKGGEPI